MVPLISGSPVREGDQIAVVTTYHGAMSLRILAYGFLEIAIVALKSATIAIDSVTPAIIYTIRHSAELFLKHVITDLAEKHGLPVEMPTGHQLLEMLNTHRCEITSTLECEATHAEHATFDYRKWLAEFELILTRLDEVDPDGQTLRYPANTKGAPNLGGRMCVSLAQLERFAQEAASCFSQFTARDC